MLNPNTLLDIVAESSNKFITGLSDLKSSEWEIPSKCHQWAIKDVSSHILAIDGFFLNSLSRAIEGDGNPTEGMPNPGTGNARSMADGIASRAIQISETAFPKLEQLLDTLSHMESNLINVFQNIALEEWHIPAYHPADKSSPYLLLKMKLLELVVHSWDIFSSLNPSYKMQNEEAKILCEVWKEPNIANWLYTPDPDQIEPTTIDFWFDGNEALRIQTWRGSLHIFDRPTEKSTEAITTVETTYQDFALLITARKNIREAYSTNLISVAGNKESLDSFHKWFRGS